MRRAVQSPPGTARSLGQRAIAGYESRPPERPSRAAGTGEAAGTPVLLVVQCDAARRSCAPEPADKGAVTDTSPPTAAAAAEGDLAGAAPQAPGARHRAPDADSAAIAADTIAIRPDRSTYGRHAAPVADVLSDWPAGLPVGGRPIPPVARKGGARPGRVSSETAPVTDEAMSSATASEPDNDVARRRASAAPPPAARSQLQRWLGRVRRSSRARNLAPKPG